ncbi:hypothetical protein IAR55_004749 [Kwoniella newhampshirensis]|uniref:Uncharacterized protein n=1 Tax=Kwoniella newhampshirensis TaxID=1651941 RepID=A0AAW0YHW6_9TREE
MPSSQASSNASTIRPSTTAASSGPSKALQKEERRMYFQQFKLREELRQLFDKPNKSEQDLAQIASLEKNIEIVSENYGVWWGKYGWETRNPGTNTSTGSSAQ